MLENTTKEILFRPASGKSTMFGVLLIVAAILLYAFLASPVADKVDAAKVVLASGSMELTGLQKKAADLDAAQKTLDLTNEVQKIDSLKAVPDKMYEDQVITDVVNIAEHNTVKLKSISFAKGSGPKEKIGSLRISASFEGNYSDLTNFLRGLEQNARIFKVDSISVQLSKLEISDTERVNFSLSIQTFFQS